MGRMTPKEITVIISKSDWDLLRRGEIKTVRVLKEVDARSYFGDRAENHIVRIKMSEDKKIL